MNAGVFNRWRYESEAIQGLQCWKEKSESAMQKASGKAEKAKITKVEKKITAILPVNTKKAGFRTI